MRKESFIQRWINFHESNQSKYGFFFLIFIALAFVLSDWTLYYFSFAEFIFMGILPILFLLGQARISKTQGLIVLGLVLLVIINNILQIFTGNETFDLRLAVFATIKLIFYLCVVTILYNYIRRNHFERTFLQVNNLFAIIVIIIGLYIMFSIYRDHEYSYRFFWTFTRQDYRSYYFSGNSDFIRVRSLFSEPAHLGYYLITILTANLLYNEVTIKKSVILFILSIGVLLTFSYSMVITLLVILGIYLLKKLNFRNLKWNYFYWIFPIAIIGFAFIFRMYIYETFIQRTIQIFSGADYSALNRLFGSWSYVDRQSWWIGIGINHTPTIINNYAYMLSDMGLFGLIPFLIFTGWTTKKSIVFGTLFLLLNISRGGYLGPSLWFLILFILIYRHTQDPQRYKLGGSSDETVKWI